MDWWMVDAKLAGKSGIGRSEDGCHDGRSLGIGMKSDISCINTNSTQMDRWTTVTDWHAIGLDNSSWLEFRKMESVLM